MLRGYCLFFIILNLVLLGNGLASKKIARRAAVCKGQEHIKVYDQKKVKDACWPEADSTAFFKGLDAIEDKYRQVRNQYQEAIRQNKFDDKFKNSMTASHGVGLRVLFKFGNVPQDIPAGLNIGGYSMFRLNDSLLVFYRMKLQNKTDFTIRELRNNLKDAVMRLKLDLHDLFLLGEYDRTLTDNASSLFYRPNHGNFYIILHNTKYEVEARYRTTGDRLMVEHILSELNADKYQIAFSNTTEACGGIYVNRHHLAIFMARLQNELDKWLKDYFNDFLQVHKPPGTNSLSAQFEEYDKKKMFFLNQIADDVLKLLNKQLVDESLEVIRVPSFRIMTLSNMTILLEHGQLFGITGMRRRSVTTVSRVPRASRAPLNHDQDDVRFVVADIGLHAKVVYKYTIINLHEKMPDVTGELVFTSNDVKAQMHLGYIRDGGFVDVMINSMEFSKIDNVVVEGPGNRLTANFKHLLEHEILSLMSNGMIHSIISLHSVMACKPKLARSKIGKIKEKLLFNPVNVMSNIVIGSGSAKSLGDCLFCQNNM